MDAPHSKRTTPRWATAVIVVLLFCGLAIVLLDWRQVRQVLAATDWKLIPLALAATAVSYTAMSYGWAVANQTFGIPMRRRELAQVGFVSTVLNNLISAGGAAGFSVRFLMMGAQGAQIKDIVAASLFYSYLSALGMLALLPIGLVYLLARHPLAGRGNAALLVATGILVVAFLLASALVFVRALRRRLLHGVTRAVQRVAHRDVSAALDDFDATMARGVEALRRWPLTLALLLGCIALDWLAALASLGVCFDALGTPLKVDVLVTGYSIGVTAGVLSMIPGGLGVQEGSMAGIYALLGAPLHQAALAAVLFRVVDYLIPYLVSFLFYWRLLRRMRKRER